MPVRFFATLSSYITFQHSTGKEYSALCAYPKLEMTDSRAENCVELHTYHSFAGRQEVQVPGAEPLCRPEPGAGVMRIPVPEVEAGRQERAGGAVRDRQHRGDQGRGDAHDREGAERVRLQDHGGGLEAEAG